MTHSCCSISGLSSTLLWEICHSISPFTEALIPTNPAGNARFLREQCGPEDRKQLERSPAVKAVGGQRIGWGKKGISSYGAWTFITSVDSLSVCLLHLGVDCIHLLGLHACGDLDKSVVSTDMDFVSSDSIVVQVFSILSA